MPNYIKLLITNTLTCITGLLYFVIHVIQVQEYTFCQFFYCKCTYSNNNEGKKKMWKYSSNLELQFYEIFESQRKGKTKKIRGKVQCNKQAARRF